MSGAARAASIASKQALVPASVARQRFSIRCANGHEFVSVGDSEHKVQRELGYFAEDGGCRCGAGLGGVFRYEVDRKGRSGPLTRVAFDLPEMPS